MTVSDEQGQTYVTCQVHTNETDVTHNQTAVPVSKSANKPAIDLASIKANAQSVLDMEDIYQRYQALGVVHSGMMKVTGKVYTLADTTYIHIKVPQASEGDAIFHPALIDGSAIGTADLFAIGKKGADERLFLPMFYEQFEASQAFGNEVITEVNHDSVVDTEQLQGFTMTFFNLAGEKLGQLSNFKNKQVRHDGLIEQSPSANASAPLDNTASDAQATQAIEVNSNFANFEQLLQSIIATNLGIAPEQVSLESGYYEMDLASASLLAVVTSLSAVLGKKLSPLLMFEYTNIKTLAAFLQQHYLLPNDQSSLPNEQNPLPNERANNATATTNKAKTPYHGGLTTHRPLGYQHNGQNSGGMRQDIAVIGMAGRYPGADDLAAFWDNLQQGVDSIETVPEDRWSQSHFNGMTSPSGKAMSQWGGFISDVDCFDPLFFNVSPKEAQVIDPQERMFLQTCWHAMEDAGYTPANIVQSDEHGRRLVGVFVGVMHKDYTLLQAQAAQQGQAISMSLNYAGIANRVSYFSDFHGPSMAIDTVCSSSLTALHLALESLYKGECQVAFAGGVNLSLHPHKYQSYGLMDFHSSNGRCTSFGADGDGYVSSEGVGAIVLKPLSHAIDAGDHIEAIIKGSAINHVGRVSGITVPSPVAQGAMIADCLRQTGIDPQTISYIETHGTGTSLGDPIEIEGLSLIHI